MAAPQSRACCVHALRVERREEQVAKRGEHVSLVLRLQQRASSLFRRIAPRRGQSARSCAQLSAHVTSTATKALVHAMPNAHGRSAAPPRPKICGENGPDDFLVVTTPGLPLAAKESGASGRTDSACCFVPSSAPPNWRGFVVHARQRRRRSHPRTHRRPTRAQTGAGDRRRATRRATSGMCCRPQIGARPVGRRRRTSAIRTPAHFARARGQAARLRANGPPDIRHAQRRAIDRPRESRAATAPYAARARRRARARAAKQTRRARAARRRRCGAAAWPTGAMARLSRALPRPHRAHRDGRGGGGGSRPH
mmetsp:Transcript_9125/g.28690  ORF Transcript_9125/g.28690 Transcript_9125/m.28690 type:complete len:310 (+) Transcript_9125:257-1186(+)